MKNSPFPLSEQQVLQIKINFGLKLIAVLAMAAVILCAVVLAIVLNVATKSN